MNSRMRIDHQASDYQERKSAFLQVEDCFSTYKAAKMTPSKVPSTIAELKCSLTQSALESAISIGEISPMWMIMQMWIEGLIRCSFCFDKLL